MPSHRNTCQLLLHERDEGHQGRENCSHRESGQPRRNDYEDKGSAGVRDWTSPPSLGQWKSKAANGPDGKPLPATVTFELRFRLND
jgi:hypothetical protein